MASKKEIIFFLLALIVSWPFSKAHASTQFGPIEFKLIPGWSCQMSQQSMICLDRSPTSSKNSAVIFTYKQKGAADSLTIYKDQLARPRVLQVGDMNQPSSPRGVREIRIQNHPWIEGIHLGSEMANYVTHYYATTDQNYGILVSLSIEAQNHETELPKLYPIVESIRLRSPEELGGGSLGQNGASGARQMYNAVTSKMVIIGGQKIHIYYIFFGVAALLVAGLLIYAIKD